MFEKEAEEYASQGGLSKEKHFFGVKAIAFKDGAEYGYNKVNEWHYVKDGLFPKEGEIVICFCRGYCGASFCATARLYIGYDDKVRRWWTNAGEGKSEQLMDVIAWKEIILPELPKEVDNG